MFSWDRLHSIASISIYLASGTNKLRQVVSFGSTKLSGEIRQDLINRDLFYRKIKKDETKQKRDTHRQANSDEFFWSNGNFH